MKIGQDFEYTVWLKLNYIFSLLLHFQYLKRIVHFTHNLDYMNHSISIISII